MHAALFAHALGQINLDECIRRCDQATGRTRAWATRRIARVVIRKAIKAAIDKLLVETT